MEKKTRILVVEDERMVARDIIETLERLGYIVPAIISTGEEAVQEAGKTYPDLVLMDIILEARIMAVAMSSHRPYRPALGIEKALEEISQNNGILYDPEVADACVRLFTEKGFAF